MPGFNIKQDGNQSPSNTNETLRKYRWLITVIEPLETIRIYASKVTLPTVEFAKITMHRGQDEIYLPGKTTFGQCEFTFYGVMAGNTTPIDKLYEWYQAVVDISTSVLKPIGELKKDINIELLDGSGNPTVKYQLLGCWPIKISPDGLDHNSNEIHQITVTVSLDKYKTEPLDQVMIPTSPSCPVESQ